MAGVVAAAAMGTGFVTAQLKEVSLTVRSPHGARHEKFWTMRRSVKGLLASAHIPYSPHDRIVPPLARPVGDAVEIQKAVPVEVNTPSRHLKAWTTEYRVRSVIRQLGIKLGPRDVVKPALSAALTGPSTVTILRRWLVHKTTTLSLPFGVQHEPDPHLAQGQTRVIRAGRSGLERIVHTIVEQNGKAVADHTTKRVVRSPLNEVIAYGTKQMVSRGGQAFQVVRKLVMVATGYWPDPSWSTGITATGVKAQYGIAAVDPSVIPLGTHLYVPGYGPAIADDTGGAIIGDRIDLCFNNGYQAIDWGVRTVTVYIEAPNPA